MSRTNAPSCRFNNRLPWKQKGLITRFQYKHHNHLFQRPTQYEIKPKAKIHPTVCLAVHDPGGLKALCVHSESLIFVGERGTLLVGVCVVASPVALCGISGGLLVEGRVTAARRPPIRRGCVVPLPSMTGAGRLSLGLCSLP